MPYVIWSIGKAGWVSPAGNYTSVLADAKQFVSRVSAMDACSKHAANKTLDWIPVLLDDLQLLMSLLK